MKSNSCLHNKNKILTCIIFSKSIGELRSLASELSAEEILAGLENSHLPGTEAGGQVPCWVSLRARWFKVRGGRCAVCQPPETQRQSDATGCQVKQDFFK